MVLSHYFLPYIFPKVFSSWMHFCAVRLFAESILRYGLPPSFLVIHTLLK